jgi:hypothetical protein
VARGLDANRQLLVARKAVGYMRVFGGSAKMLTALLLAQLVPEGF